MVNSGKKYTSLVYTLSHFHSSQWFFSSCFLIYFKVIMYQPYKVDPRKDEHEQMTDEG